MAFDGEGRSQCRRNGLNGLLGQDGIGFRSRFQHRLGRNEGGHPGTLQAAVQIGGNPLFEIGILLRSENVERQQEDLLRALLPRGGRRDRE